MAVLYLRDPKTGKFIPIPTIKGEDGESVTVTNVSESTEDGGANVVTFSDGTTVIIHNGSKGSKGDPGGISIDTAEVGQMIVVKKTDENGKPTEWEAVDVERGLPETGLPHQQLVTDGAGNTVWEDKLAYAEKHSGEIYPEMVVPFFEDANAFGIVTPPAYWPTGKIVATITYNGVSYTCEGARILMEGQEVTAYGNPYIIDGTVGSDIPFMLFMLDRSMAEQEGVYGVIYVLDGATSVTISMTAEWKIIKRFSAEFLPDTSPIIYYDGVDDSYLYSRYQAGQLPQEEYRVTKTEFMSALTAGRQIWIQNVSRGTTSIVSQYNDSKDYVQVTYTVYNIGNFNTVSVEGHYVAYTAEFSE